MSIASLDLVQNMFNGIVRDCFPEASEVDLYGAGITMDWSTGAIIRVSCGGKVVEGEALKNHLTTKQVEG